MKNIIFLSLFMFISFVSFSQSIEREVVSNGGDSFSNSNNTIEWTIGEVVTETAVGTNNTLTQGFHQGLYTLVNIEQQITNSSINVYPNPSTDYINIDITGDNSNNYQIQLYDNIGKLLINKSYNNAKKISLQQYASSVYYLKVINTKDDKFDTYKILKK